MLHFLYCIYQIFVFIPLLILSTIVTALTVIIGTMIGDAGYWGYYPGKWWARFVLGVLLIPVKVEGRENLKDGQSYVFVSNHQGAFDIFLIFGYLCRNFKWMMKQQLRKMPFVGKACAKSNQIFVDKRGPSKIKQTYDKARDILRHGTSVVVFPEGARTFTGHMGKFRRGAFMLADDLELPVAPITINGSFNIMPRTKDWHFVHRHRLSLTIHKPIEPIGRGAENINNSMEKSYAAIMSALVPEYQGYVENPDQ
ncbi:MAG: lysophospholipid acyltransferase family protein [Prevotella sp.]|uniref:lysophospholipid acyltransferase family protein n=1 Tax=Prevotella sp. TaxID=59823 RepID=UPI002A27DBB5|nr:lysophospholipid acyltransferase family protein [Prevotella sp.]MDD7317479.1 lysophospholipid acyltransferase family protein [Prevotellaceae bacterium]MDY4019185.1 lysophospholipid acyltransferase family protein [Prevotella sp.]